MRDYSSWATLWATDPAELYRIAKDAPRLPPVVRQWVKEWEEGHR